MFDCHKGSLPSANRKKWWWGQQKLTSWSLSWHSLHLPANGCWLMLVVRVTGFNPVETWVRSWLGWRISFIHNCHGIFKRSLLRQTDLETSKHSFRTVRWTLWHSWWGLGCLPILAMLAAAFFGVPTFASAFLWSAFLHVSTPYHIRRHHYKMCKLFSFLMQLPSVPAVWSLVFIGLLRCRYPWTWGPPHRSTCDKVTVGVASSLHLFSPRSRILGRPGQTAICFEQKTG